MVLIRQPFPEPILNLEAVLARLVPFHTPGGPTLSALTRVWHAPHRHRGEKKWQRLRRDGVQLVVARRRGRASTSIDTAGGLTLARCKVSEKRRQKGAKRKANALLDGGPAA